MNENWPEIVETLIPYFETNSVEGDYQREIENCLKFLGWKKTNGTMVSQYTLPIGNSNSIRPDIVLWRKNEHDTQSPVLPIEIKRPSNIRNERHCLLSHPPRRNRGLRHSDALFRQVPWSALRRWYR